MVAFPIIQQDDYFVYPPLTNLKMRQKDIGWVGTSEVKLELLDQNLADILAGKDEIKKPWRSLKKTALPLPALTNC